MGSIGGIFILLIILAIIGFTAQSIINNVNNNILIENCEKELPRNQKCVLIAVPLTEEITNQ